MNAAIAEDLFFGLGGVGFTADYGTGMSHTFSLGAVSPAINPTTGFVPFLNPFSCFGFHITAYFAYHDNAFCFGIGFKKFDGIEGRCSNDGVATDADGSGCSPGPVLW